MSEQGRKYDSVLSSQHGGKHYKEKGIQPIEYANANDLSFFQGNVVKYVTRYKDKKGVEDVKKAIHYLQMILEFEYGVLTDFSYSDTEEIEELQTEDISEDTLSNYLKTLNVKVVDDKFQVTPKLWYPPVEDGGNPWIEWKGDKIPVGIYDSTLVDLLYADEREHKTFDSWAQPADRWPWDDPDIVAYRIVD